MQCFHSNQKKCLSFVPSALQPTHKAPWTQLYAAGQTWSWGGRATAGLKTQLVGSPEMQHWAEGHRYTYTKPPAIWNTEMQTEQGQNCQNCEHFYLAFVNKFFVNFWIFPVQQSNLTWQPWGEHEPRRSPLSLGRLSPSLPLQCTPGLSPSLDWSLDVPLCQPYPVASIKH